MQSRRTYRRKCERCEGCFPSSEMTKLNGDNVCRTCADLVIEKLKENQPTKTVSRDMEAREPIEAGDMVVVEPITQHEGGKYLRAIYSATEDSVIMVDVYCVLEAFNVTCPATAHAIKKLLCAGLRNKGDRLADLIGALAAINRAIELERKRK